MSTTTEFPLLKLPSEQIDQITKQARQVHFWRTVAGLIGGIIFIIGWLTAKVFTLLWFASVWCALAARAGWRDAKGMPPPGPSVEQLLRENAALRAELSRVS